jgi:hypothetical protein
VHPRVLLFFITITKNDTIFTASTIAVSLFNIVTAGVQEAGDYYSGPISPSKYDAGRRQEMIRLVMDYTLPPFLSLAIY